MTEDHNNEVFEVSDNMVVFGSYPQTYSREKLPIEWQILEKEDNKAFIVSKYCLELRPYERSGQASTWETCTLRKWLNCDFLTKAFSEKEQERILDTEVNVFNPRSCANPGNPTVDKIFLLSLFEVEYYFDSDEKRKCIGTPYEQAFEKELQEAYGIAGTRYIDIDDHCCDWWLRSIGQDRYMAVAITATGMIATRGELIGARGMAVRPAMWIRLDT